MPIIERVLWALVATLIVVTIGIGIGAYLNPAFAAIAPGLLTAMVGPLITAISGLGGALLSRGLKQAVREEIRREQQNGGEDA